MADETWFQKLVKDAVKECGSQTRFAERVGVSRQRVNEWMQGRSPRNVDIIKRVLEEFGGEIKLPEFGRDKKVVQRRTK